MIPRMTLGVLRGVCGFLLVFLPLGCSKGGSRAEPSREAAHIAAAANAVKRYMSENKGQIPKSTDEIKTWAANNNIADDALVSTRDHEPYLVFETTMAGMGKQLILTEKTGVNGKKFMVSNMTPKRVGVEATEEEVQNMIKGVAPGRPKSAGPPK
jgi:hypothetical protein